jgi:hypothetical protein
MDDLTPEDLKDVLLLVRMISANMENWKYVKENAEYLDKKRVTEALGQMLDTFSLVVDGMQGFAEIEALTRLNPDDLM